MCSDFKTVFENSDEIIDYAIPSLKAIARLNNALINQMAMNGTIREIDTEASYFLDCASSDIIQGLENFINKP